MTVFDNETVGAGPVIHKTTHGTESGTGSHSGTGNVVTRRTDGRNAKTHTGNGQAEDRNKEPLHTGPIQPSVTPG
eukprot:6945533-Karenia_brevis.AAC.1